MSLFSFFKGTPAKTIDDIFDKKDGMLAKVGAWYGSHAAARHQSTKK